MNRIWKVLRRVWLAQTAAEENQLRNASLAVAYEAFSQIILRKEDKYKALESDEDRFKTLQNLARQQDTTFLSIWTGEDRGKYSSFWKFRWFSSRHTKKLEIAASALVLLPFALLFLYFPARSTDHEAEWQLKVMGSFIGPAVWLGLFQLMYAVGSKRRATATMIIAEVISIIRVYASANIIGAFVRKYLEASEATDTQIGGFADVARKENYLTIFDKNIENLGAFPNPLVFDLSAFYTFLKAARDATGALALWSKADYPVEQKKNDVIDIVYLCFLQLEHGKLALNNLLEKHDKDALELMENVSMGTCLQSYLFLLHVIDVKDFRYPGLISRLLKYQDGAKRNGYTRLWDGACPLLLKTVADLACETSKANSEMTRARA